MVQPASIDDAPGLSGLAKVVYPDALNTAAHFRHRMETARPEHRYVTWKVERNGTIVGSARAGLEAFASEPGRAVAFLMVHPDHRRDGIGSELWAAASSHLEDIGAVRVVTQTRDDEPSRRFCEQRGFHHAAQSETLALDPRSLPPAPKEPEGVELCSFVSLEDRASEVYDADLAAFQDEPGAFDSTGMTFDQWLDMTFRHPDFAAELSQVAVVGGEIAGSSFLYVDRVNGKAANGGTGVVPAHRGRGLATLLKRHALSRAARSAITQVLTENDETNAAMLAINRKLGYEPFGIRHSWTLDR